MIDFDSSIKNIRNLYKVISGTSVDVSLTYKGNEYGVINPWSIRVGDRETSKETYELALSDLTAILKKEIADKVKSAEAEASRLRQALGQLGN